MGGMTGSEKCGCRPIQKARGRFPGAGSKILAMTLAYTKALLNRGTAVDVTVSAAGWCVANPIAARCKPAATDYRRRLSSCDAEYMQVICPTGQGLMHRTI
jgi:hypothetical protein